MITLEDLEKWFKDLNRIIFDINVSIENIKRIKNSTDEYEKQILKHGFFSHFYRQSRFTIIVQLCKIFADNGNQKRNVNKLFNRLTSDEYDVKINEQLSKNHENVINDVLAQEFGVTKLFCDKKDITTEIASLKIEIDAQKELIDKIIVLRDKFYAHSDPDPDIPIVTDEELETLVKLSIKIFNRIRGRLLDINFLFDINADWRIDYPIKSLALQRKEQIEKISKK